jgi:hypothetical protein
VFDFAVLETVEVFDLELDIELDDKFDVEFMVEFDTLLVDRFEFASVTFELDRFAFVLFAGADPQPKLITRAVKNISTRIIDLFLLYLPNYSCPNCRGMSASIVSGPPKSKVI